MESNSGRFSFDMGVNVKSDKFVANLFFDPISDREISEQWGEISREDGQMLITIYPKLDRRAWVFDLDSFIGHVNEARTELLRHLPDLDEPNNIKE